jgi:hypothetical protein
MKIPIQILKNLLFYIANEEQGDGQGELGKPTYIA